MWGRSGRGIAARSLLLLAAAGVMGAGVAAGMTLSGKDRGVPSPSAKGSAGSAAAASSDGLVVEGATATLVFPEKRGTLWISIKRLVRGSTSPEKIILEAERGGGCVLHRVLGNNYNADCPVLWTVKRRLDPGAFAVDLALTQASLDTTLKGKELQVRWWGSGSLENRPGSGQGYLLLQTREARSTARWGNHQWAWPDRFATKEAGVGLLYRRIEEGP